MSLIPETQYPGKIAPSSPDYPYGAARNITVPGDGTGTPWEAALVNDMFGFFQAMLTEGGVVPSGNPDTAQVSQYLQALKNLFLSGVSQPVADVDAVSATGFYIATGATVGTAPPGGLVGELFHIERGSSNQATQVFDTLVGAGAPQQLYARTKRSDNSWSPWSDMLASGGGGGGSPAGADKQIQYNAGGAFGAKAGFEFDTATDVFEAPYGKIGDGTAFDANSIPGDDPHWLEITNNPGNGASGDQLFRMNSYGNAAYGNNIHSCRYFGSEASPEAIQNNAFLMSWGFRGHDGSQLSQSAAAFQCQAVGNWTSGNHGTQFAFEVTPQGATSRQRSFVITANGDIAAGMGAPVLSYHQIAKDVQQGNPVLRIGNNSNGLQFLSANGGGANPQQAALRINASSMTNRSINASGTINASGSDYAEYMRKSDGCGEFKKGDVVGIDANGELTDVYSEALSFAVKSTDPSYVGGDAWGRADYYGLKDPQMPKDDSENELARWEAEVSELEALVEKERHYWDRIAFCGRVPVNVSGAAAGDYLVPREAEDGGITAEPVSNPSFEDYRRAVGRVAAIQDDGRPFVIVKMG